MGGTGAQAHQGMKVCFDTNVLLDVRLRRPRWIESAKAINRSEKEGVVLISTLTLANVSYIIGDSRLSRCAAEIDWMLESFTLLTLGEGEARAARKLGLDDYEDALQLQCAVVAGADWFVTRNTDDFPRRSRIPVVTPETFLNKTER